MWGSVIGRECFMSEKSAYICSWMCEWDSDNHIGGWTCYKEGGPAITAMQPLCPFPKAI